MQYSNEFMTRLGYKLCSQWHDGRWGGIVPNSCIDGYVAADAFGPNLNPHSRRSFAEGWDRRLREATPKKREPLISYRGKVWLGGLLWCVLFWVAIFKFITR